MYRPLMALLLFLPAFCSAQNYKFDFGLSVPVYFRSAHHNETLNEHKNLFGAIGLNGVVRIQGADENSMSFLLNAGVMDDIRKFNVTLQDKVRSNLYFVNINPSVLIPSKWERLQFSLGIGALVQVGQKASFSWGKSYQGAGYVTSTDSLDGYLNRRSRGIMPYLSLGITANINQHLILELTIQPTLLDLYDPGTNVFFYYNTGSNLGKLSFGLNYQPVYVGFRLYYFFKNSKVSI